MSSVENRIIFHVDMDAFFVSVEEALNPKLRGKPVVVGGSPDGRGVVSSASYKAREYGIRSAMPISKAKRLCPRAIFLRGSMHMYSEYSRRVMEILGRYTPDVEKVSVDEAYMDLTHCRKMHKQDPVTLAQNIHHAIREETGLPASIGIGSTRLIAKIAANAAKPDGIMMIRPGYEASFLAPLPIGKMPGVGPSTEKVYKSMGVEQIGDLARLDPTLLKRVFGKYGPVMARRARGEDRREVTASDAGDGTFGQRGNEKSISREVTYSEDTQDVEKIKATLSYMSENVGKRVRAAGLLFRTVTLKLRYSDFATYTRSRTLPVDSEDSNDIYNIACDLLDNLLAHRRGVRLVGVGVATHGADAQLDLFGRTEHRSPRLHREMDRVRGRFGFDSVLLARSCLHGSRRYN